MKNLGPDARALIAAGRERARPSAADRDRVGDKLAKQLPAFAALASTAQITSAAAQTAASSVTVAAGAAGGVAGKLAMLSAIAAATALTATSILLVGSGDRPSVQRPQTAAHASPMAVPVPSASAEPVPAVRPVPVVPTPGPSSRPLVLRGAEAAMTEALEAERERVVRARRAALPLRPLVEAHAREPQPPPERPIVPELAGAEPPAISQAPAAPTAPALEPVAAPPMEARATTIEASAALPSGNVSALALELRLLDSARSALRSGDPERALALTGEHAANHPRSELVQERLALSALALCALSREEAAQRALAELEQRAPGSPLATGVRMACGARVTR